MNVFMAGIDHQRAGLKEREPFAFTANSLRQSLERVAETYPHLGCVIISTCNRTEIWISGAENPAPEQLLCDLKGLSLEENRDLFLCRRGEAAAAHLFLLTGGLESQIMGENQILAQVKEAWETARHAKSIDPALDRLFRTAVTCAKRIKTETGITRANPSTAAAAVSCIAARYPMLAGLRCMVIGNGVIGRLTAELLARRGCAVAITLRQHKQNLSVAPQGCAVLDYDDRYAALPGYDVVISATTSPHYTVTLTGLAATWDGRERLFIDLAVPRDMDSELQTLPGLTLVDMDHLVRADSAGPDDEEQKKIEAIVNEGIAEFSAWYGFRNHIDSIDDIREAASAEIVTRLERTIQGLVPDEESREKLRGAISHASEMVVGKMLFGLRETMESSAWEPCFGALREAAAFKTQEYCRG
ncbi:glutamyl-tRNA reductase [Spirochaetia bacterium]|nr:glutamyl-tRNA reductase [Spirochaetia bacterium]